MVDDDTGEVYWCWEDCVYRSVPEAGNPVRLVNRVPEEV